VSWQRPECCYQEQTFNRKQRPIAACRILQSSHSRRSPGTLNSASNDRRDFLERIAVNTFSRRVPQTTPPDRLSYTPNKRTSSRAAPVTIRGMTGHDRRNTQLPRATLFALDHKTCMACA
jgi:hypothetical protein